MINKKIFLNGINQDDSYALVDKADYLNAVNMRFATSENGKAGQLSKIEGNVLKNARIGGTFTLPAGTNECIGAYEDVPSRRVFYFNKNSNGNHGIYCYDADTDLNYTVLLSSQIVGGLGFSSFIHSIAMVDNLLFWTDNVNPQRRINVEAGIKLNQVSYSTTVSPYVLDKNSSGGSGSTHMASSVITLIRNQPWAPLTVVKVNNAGYINNFIKDEAFQFTYRFVYRDGEVSTFSPLSKLLNYNPSGSNLNAVDVTIPLAQKIEQDVVSVEIGVRYALDGSVIVIKTFTTGFTAHNSGTALTFRFYNDTVGVSVDNASAVKPFDSIPRTSKTLEIAKNRLFLGNNLDGYDTPTTTTLTVTTATAGSTGTVNGQWYKIVYRSGGVTIVRYWLYIVDITTNPGYYVPASQPSLPIPATSVDYTTLTYAGGGLNTIATYLGIPVSDILALQYQGPTITITNATASSIVGALAFKSAATYRAGLVFFDESGRKSGVVTNDTIVAATPDRDYDTIAFVTQINWSLDNNNNPAAQIPDWATHYAVVRTKCLRTSFFLQLRADDVEYIEKNATTGEYGSRHDNYNVSYFGIAINAKSLFNSNLGYQYEEGSGDILKLYIQGGATYSLRVKDQFGEYIICDLENIGSLGGVTAMYEIYTPYVGSTNEPYFEVGDIYKVENPGQNTRRFSTISGSFRGDVYILQRTIPSSKLYEAMAPIDKYWKNWFTDIGRATIVLSIGATSKPVSIYYSNVILQGTKTNGLSTFEAPSQTNLPTDLKQINRLVLTSKVQLEGTVMLAVGEQETASIYIGEAQIFDNSGNSFLATTTGVIGNVNIMKGSFGTINPESVYKWKGEVMYFDANKGSWVRYNANGLFPISANKMAKYFRKVGQDILAYFRNPAEYNAANPNFTLRVLGAVDPYHEEYLCHVPRMYVNTQNTILNDMELTYNSIPFTTSEGVIGLSNPIMTFSYVLGSGPSASQSSEFFGTSLNINGTITAYAPPNYEVSFDNLNFGPTAALPYTGINKSGFIYVRLKAGLAGGSYGFSTVVINDGTSGTVLNVNGTVTVPVTPLINTSTSVLGGFTYIFGSGPSTAQSFTVSASNLTPSSGNITITPSTNYEVSVTSGTTGFSSSPVTLAYTSGGTLAANTVWVRLKAGLSAANYNSEIIAVSGGGATTKNVTCSGVVSSGAAPTIYPYTNSGYGLSESAACSMAAAGLTTLTSTSDPSTFGPGSVVYTNPSGTSVLTGYTHIFMNGANWDIDPIYGVVIAYSSTQC